MDNYSFLKTDDYQERNPLEADVMRFLAIILSVLWIIFMSVQESTFSSTNPQVEKSLAQVPHIQAPLLKDKKSAKTKEAKKKVTSTNKTNLVLQFEDLKTIQELEKKGEIQIFGRAEAGGFDLFFTGAVQDDTVCFKGVSELPDYLWEIKNHKDQTYFVDLMTKTYPSIRSFPSKQILVCFIDKDLEKRVEQNYYRLQSEGKNGVLSITRTGEVEFQESSSEPAALTTGVVD